MVISTLFMVRDMVNGKSVCKKHFNSLLTIFLSVCRAILSWYSRKACAVCGFLLMLLSFPICVDRAKLFSAWVICRHNGYEKSLLTIDVMAFWASCLFMLVRRVFPRRYLICYEMTQFELLGTKNYK